jgi:hypothetical protein
MWRANELQQDNLQDDAYLPTNCNQLNNGGWADLVLTSPKTLKDRTIKRAKNVVVLIGLCSRGRCHAALVSKSVEM